MVKFSTLITYHTNPDSVSVTDKFLMAKRIKPRTKTVALMTTRPLRQSNHYLIEMYGLSCIALISSTRLWDLELQLLQLHTVHT